MPTKKEIQNQADDLHKKANELKKLNDEIAKIMQSLKTKLGVTETNDFFQPSFIKQIDLISQNKLGQFLQARKEGEEFTLEGKIKQQDITQKRMIKIGLDTTFYFLDPKTNNIPGFTRHPNHPQLYLSISPEIALKLDDDRYVKNDDGEQEVIQNYQKDTINLVYTQHPHTTIHIVVLGDTQVHSHQDKLIQNSTFESNERLGTNISTVAMHTIPVSEAGQTLTEYDFDTIYNLYKNIFNKNEPVIIYSTQNVDLAPQLMLALVLKHRFNEIFNQSKNTIANIIKDEILKIRSTFSMTALQEIQGVQNAIQMALVLQAIECHKMIIEKFKAFGQTYNSSANQTKSTEIENMIATLNEEENIIEKVKILDQPNTILEDHQNKKLNRFSNLFHNTPVPTDSELFKTMVKEVLEIQNELQLSLLQQINPNEYQKDHVEGNPHTLTLQGME